MRTRTVTAILLFLALSCVGLPALPAGAQGDCPLEDSPGCTHGLPTPLYDELLKEMTTYIPPVKTLPVDVSQVDSYTFYKVAPGAPVFDAPSGNIVGNIGDGFNFVSVYGVKDGFARMRDGTWLRLGDLRKTFASEFSGVTFPKPLKYPIAWVIQAAIPARFPGGVIRATDPAVNRHTLVNIYATVRKNGWNWYLVGPGQWLEQRKLSVVNPEIQPDYTPQQDEHWVAVDLFEQVIKAYEGDTLIGATLVSTGLPGWNTNLGVFKVYDRYALAPMSSAMGQADGWSLPQVPYVMFFDRDISLHGVYWHDGFGFKRSRGCVNLSISDARWLYEWAGDDPLTVVIWDSGQQGIR